MKTTLVRGEGLTQKNAGADDSPGIGIVLVNQVSKSPENLRMEDIRIIDVTVAHIVGNRC